MWRHAIPLLGLCLLTFGAGLGSPPITDSDEAFYAESAREMVESGDWLTPRFNYTERFEKPVLYYWLVALAYRLLGVGETAARLPSALAGVGLALVALVAGSRWLGPRTGRLAGVITATSFGIVIMARQALPDLTLSLCITVSIWAGLEAWDAATTSDRPEPGRRVRTWLTIAAVAAGTAVLAKGPVGLVLPALVVAPLIGLDWWRTRRRPSVTAVDLIVAAGACLLVAGPWFAAMAGEHGLAYLDRFFVGENLDRFATARYNAPRPFWYYGPIVASGLLPWAPYLLLWIRDAIGAVRRRLAPSAMTVRLAWWAAAPVLFYTLSVGKQPRYVLPVLTPLALLLARSLSETLDRSPRDRWLVVGTVASGGILVVVGGLVHRAAPLFVDWPPSWLVLSATAIGAAGVAVMLTGFRTRWAPHAMSAAAVVLAVVAHGIVLSTPGPSPVERMATALVTRTTPEERTSRYNIFNRNLIFYTGRPFVELNEPDAAMDFLAEPGPVFLILPEDEAQELATRGARLRPLDEVRYFNTGSLTPRILLNPDPGLHVRTILLVTNR